MMELFSDALKTVMHRAFGLTDNALLTEHLLIALAEGDGVASRTLSTCGITGAELRSANPVGEGHEFGAVPFSFGAKQALEVSLQKTRDRGHHTIDTIDLLLAVLEVEPSGARSTLQAAEVDLQVVLEAAHQASATGHRDQ